MTILYLCKCMAPSCNLPSHSGGWEGSPQFVVSSAMGDRRCGEPPCIAWNSYSDSALLKTVQSITEVLQQRLGQPSSTTVASDLPVSSGTTAGGQPSGGSDQGLIKPWACVFTCRWCESACTRKEGHSFHSCYEHRHRR